MLSVPVINNIMTFAECSFNIVGYLPARSFPELSAWGIKWRARLGGIQITAGAALYLIGRMSFCPAPSSYLTLPQQMMWLGLLYANHGAYNLMRAYLMRSDLSGLTLAYDFYGRKFLPALSPSFDFPNLLFEKIKDIFDRLYFVTLIPPHVSFRMP